MAMLVGFVLAAVSVLLAGGDLRRLSSLRFRHAGLLALALAFQLLISSLVRNKGVGEAAHIASYLLIFTFLAINVRVVGVPIIAVGALLNFIAITANGGVMPADPAAMKRAGISPDEDEFTISTPVEHPRLLALGDRFNFPESWPADNPFSVGDVLIVLGAAVGMHTVSGSRLVPRRFSAARRNT